MSHTPVIIDLFEVLEITRRDLQEFQTKYPLIRTLISEDDIKRLVMAYIEDKLITNVRWYKYPNCLFDALCGELFSWQKKAKNSEIADELYANVLKYMCKTMDQFLQTLSVGEWDVWAVRWIGKKTILLSMMGDYRILDWERRMASGVWKPCND